MITLRASGQSTRGSARRSALLRSHAMSPSRPPARKAAKPSRASGALSARAKRTASNPNERANARMASRSGFACVFGIGLIPGLVGSEPAGGGGERVGGDGFTQFFHQGLIEGHIVP